MTQLLKTVAQVARSMAAVLIRGETGVGKELIARAVHANSVRRTKPYITLHCGAIPESLFEAELFGHKKGAFTGATQDREGRIAQADGGTLFIDEVGEIPLASQAKLLRFFQSGEYQRIGSDHVKRVDVRIVTATHRNLEAMVAEGRFRQDLFYRLNVLALSVPPLRERPLDIPLLIQHFFEKFWLLPQKPRLHWRIRQALETYAYPGNVRELGHAIERICVLAETENISSELLPEPILAFARSLATREKPMLEEPVFESFTKSELKRVRDRVVEEGRLAVERAFVAGLLAETEGSVAKAASHSGINRTYLYRLVKKLGL